MKIAITGSTGLIGTALVEGLRADGHQVIRLVRRPAAHDDEITWNPRAGRGAISPAALAGVDAVIHLAGAAVAGRRWTESYKAEIRESRVQGTRALVCVLSEMSEPPGVLLCGSAIGWYGDTGGKAVDESAPSGRGFLAEVVRDWEAAAEPAAQAGIRVVRMRNGIVLSPRGGMLARLLLPFRFGLGARLGSGAQVMSWIGLTELTRIVRFLLDQPEISGPVNLTTPNPVSNAEFTAALAALLHRPAVFIVPTSALKVAVGGVSSDLLSSARVIPGRLLAAGYQYQSPDLPGALATELSS
jgi:uncharacterized protein (TIGR01777 family)